METVKSGLPGCVHAGDNKTQITTLHTWEHALSGVTFLIHFVTQYIGGWSDLCLQCALPCATASVNVVKLYHEEVQITQNQNQIKFKTLKRL